jgi:hypothetical protein
VRLHVLVALALVGCGETPAPARDEVEGRFVPATRRDGGRTVMPLTFLDRTREFGNWTVEVWDVPGDPAAMTGRERRDFPRRAGRRFLAAATEGIALR